MKIAQRVWSYGPNKVSATNGRKDGQRDGQKDRQMPTRLLYPQNLFVGGSKISGEKNEQKKSGDTIFPIQSL